MSLPTASPCDEALIRSTEADAPCRAIARPWILATVILASSMVFIDGTVANVALPALQQEFKATTAEAQWVIESYALLLAALLLVGGSAGDRFGRRRVFVIGVALFALASVGCGMARSVQELILARAVQGVGGALLVPGCLAIISASFPENLRGKAIGTWSGFTSITAALGPVIGGFLIEHFSWRYAFLINLPIAVAILFLAFRKVPESRNPHAGARLDWLGALLISAALGLAVLALIDAPAKGWGNTGVLLTMAGALIATAAFIGVELSHPSPMLPLALFRSRNFSGANLLTLFLYAALGGSLFFLPLNLIQVQGYSAMAAGAALLPFILTMFLLSRWAGGLVDKYGAKQPLVIGPAIAAAGFFLYSLPGIGGSYWTTYLPAALVLGLGMAISVAPLTTTVMNALERNLSGIASGVNNAVSRVAALLAIALFGIVMTYAFGADLQRRTAEFTVSQPVATQVLSQKNKLAAIELPNEASADERRQLETAIGHAYIHGFRWVMLLSAGLALASSLCAFLMIDGRKSS
jgi:EmrB/QacA subfamily drug resistance transporter